MDGLRDARSETCPRCGRPAAGTERFCLVCKTAMPFASAHSDDADTALTPLPTPDSDAGTTTILPAASQRTSGDATTLTPTPQASFGQTRGVPGASDAESGPLTIGQRFGRYTIARLLGIGGMGAVYQAWDEELEVVVALKVIRPEVRRDPSSEQEVERRFKRELVLARQVTHKNVVRIHDLGEIGGIKYITMPYVEGSDLATTLRHAGQLTPLRALHIARGIVAGLAAAHKAGVVHRDLKPANIMIEADSGEAVIMDFGIARSTGGSIAPRRESMTTAMTAATPTGRVPLEKRAVVAPVEVTMVGAVIGTIEYMAPEQARSALVDQRADIYAFGLIVYDMLAGRRRAASDASAIDELHARMAHPPPSVRTIARDVPEPFARVIARCLEPEPGARYQTTEELQNALDRLDERGHLLPARRSLNFRVAPTGIAVALALDATSWWYGWRS